jgi:hypothetical protein
VGKTGSPIGENGKRAEKFLENPEKISIPVRNEQKLIAPNRIWMLTLYKAKILPVPSQKQKRKGVAL